MSFEKQKTVRVRIAVAVDVKGKWNASGWGTADGADKDVAIDGLEGDEQYVVHYIEADVPVPASQTVAGVLPDELCRSADAIADHYPHLANLMRAEATGAVPSPTDVAWGCSFEIAMRYMTAIAKRVGLPDDAKWPDIMEKIPHAA